MEMLGHSSHLRGLDARTDPSPVSDGTNWCPGAGKARPGEKARAEGRGIHAKLGPSPHISEKAVMKQNKRKTMFFHQRGEGTTQ